MTKQPTGFANKLSRKGPTKKQVQEWQEKTAKAISEHGRQVVRVMGAADGGIDWMYTLGNEITQDTPEVITWYPSDQTAPWLLNHFSEALKSGEVEPFEDHETRVIPGFLGENGEIPVRARLLSKEEQLIARQEWTCQLPPSYRVIVVELPDPAGHFPGDPECHPGVKEVYEQVPYRAL